MKINILKSENDLNIILYNNSTVFFVKTLAIEYAKHFNYSVNWILFQYIQNINNIDLSILENQDFKVWEPNPFTITSIAPFYRINNIIPIVNIDKFRYFFLQFTNSVWTLILISPIYFAIILKISEYKIKFSNHFFRTLMILLEQSIKIKESKIILRIIYFLIFLFSSIISTIYLSYLGSFLTKAIDKTAFPILCPEQRITLIENNKNINFFKVNYSEYLKNLFNLNVKYGYCISSIFWDRPLEVFIWKLFTYK